MPVARVVNYVSQLRNKKPHLFSLVFEAEGEALLLHGDEAAARLSFPAIDRNIQRQAGILVVQPVGAQVADKVVQCCNSVNNQLLFAQCISNYFVIVLHGNADGSREAFELVAVILAERGCFEFQGASVYFGILLCMCYEFLLAPLIVRSSQGWSIGPIAQNPAGSDFSKIIFSNFLYCCVSLLFLRFW